MSGRTLQLLRPTSPEGRARRWLPFWVLQAVELAVAVVFVDISIHVSNGGLLVAGAVAYAVLAVSARGPLGIVHVCSQSLHLVLVIIVSVLVALAPVVAVLRPDIEGIIVVEFGAVGLLRVCTLTRVSSVIDTTAIESTAVVADATAPTPPSPMPPPSDAAARWAGRTSGAVAATGRRVAAAYGPKAGEQVRQSIRKAGRKAGRIAGSAATPPKEPDQRG